MPSVLPMLRMSLGYSRMA